MQGTLQTPRIARSAAQIGRVSGSGRARAVTETAPSLPLRALGALGLLGIVTSAFVLAAGAASAPSNYVRVHHAGWPSWLAGPYEGLGIGIGQSSFQTLTLVMLGGYLVVLLSARTLPASAIGAAIVLAHVVLLLGPPLLSQDIFGYLSFARLGAVHGLDPYTHVAAEAASDPTFPYIGWPFQHTPYGPLFTLGSYAVAQLGIAGGLWAFKAIAMLTSLGAVALVAKAARLEGRSGRAAAAFLGLNPVLLEFAVGGAHNDTITLLLVSAALAIAASATVASANTASAAIASAGTARAEAGTTARAVATTATRSVRRLRVATWPLAAAVGFKVSSGLLLPFLVLHPRAAAERVRMLISAICGLAIVAVIGAIGFGPNLLGFFVPIGEEQQQVAVHSIPAETARLVGLAPAPTWWRYLFVAGFVCVMLLCLWRTAKGWDWRVAAGWSTFALVISTAWLLPWYAVWALPLAAVSGERKLKIATILFCVYALMIRLPLAEPLLGSRA